MATTAGIGSLQHVGMQLNLEGKTKEFQCPVSWKPLFLPSKMRSFPRAAKGLLRIFFIGSDTATPRPGHFLHYTKTASLENAEMRPTK